MVKTRIDGGFPSARTEIVGDLHLNDGSIFGGSLKGSDAAGRIYNIGREAASSVTDSAGNILDDLPDAQFLSSAYRMGRLYLFNDDEPAHLLVQSVPFTQSVWQNGISIITLGNTNTRGARLIFEITSNGGTATGVSALLYLRPNGATNANGYSRRNMGFNAGGGSPPSFASASLIGDIDVPVNDKKFDWYASLVPTDGVTNTLRLRQIGIWV